MSIPRNWLGDFQGRFYIHRPALALRLGEMPSIERQLSIPISNSNIGGDRDGQGTRGYAQEDHPQATASRDGPACRQHHLRNGAARRISTALRPLAPRRRLGLGGGGSLAGFPPISPDCPRAASGRQATAIAACSSAGSGSSSGIEGGMRTGTRFLPDTQASMTSDHSCIMWRR